MSAGRTVIVIGGGVNGMVAALTLERAGHDVLLVEQRETIGGAASLRENTAMFNEDLARRLDISVSRASAPSVLITGNAGEHGLVLHADESRMDAELRQHAPDDREAWTELCEQLDAWRPWIRRILEQRPPNVASWKPLDLASTARTGLGLRRLGKDTMMEILRVVPMCIADWLNEWFVDERLKAGLALPCLEHTWLGPWSPQSAANFLRRDALMYFPVSGGSEGLISALRTRIDGSRVMVKTKTRVTKVLTDDDQVTGVTFEDGSQRSCDAIVATCDPSQVFGTMFQSRAIATSERMHADNYRMRGTASIAHLTLNEPLRWSARPDETFGEVRVVSTLDNLERAFDPIKYRTFGPMAALTVKQHTETAATVTTSWIPHTLDGGWTDARREALRELIRAALADHVTDMSVVSDMTVTTPADIEDAWHLRGGHLDHGELSLDQMIIRPWWTAARYGTTVDGLFVAGGGSHPGGGETGLPGHLGARAAIRGIRKLPNREQTAMSAGADR